MVPGEKAFVVPSMRLLRIGAELHKAGVPLDAILDELHLLRRDIDRVAERFVQLVVKHVFDKHPVIPTGKDAQHLGDMVRRMRPMAFSMPPFCQGA